MSLVSFPVNVLWSLDVACKYGKMNVLGLEWCENL